MTRGEAIKKIRKYRQLTQLEVAELGVNMVHLHARDLKTEVPT